MTRLSIRWLIVVALACGLADAARAEVVLDDFSSGDLRRWDLSDPRVVSAVVVKDGPEGKPCLALTSRANAGWAAVALPFPEPLDLRDKYLSVWLKQDSPATVQFEFNCQPGPGGYLAYFLHEVPDFVGAWQHLCLRLDARSVLHGQPQRDHVVRLRISRQATGPQGTVWLADLRIVGTAPAQTLSLLPADVRRFTPPGPGAGPLARVAAPVRLGATPGGRDWTTSAPFVDLLNYEEKLTPDYVARMASCSPDVFHAGNVAPFKPYWGPSRDHSFAESPLTGPNEVRRQIAELRQFVAGMHRAGVARVLSSSCSITIGGSPTRRLGMWAFYDHWNDYLGFGLPPKPAHDPLTWNQKDRFGKDRNPYGQPFTTWTDKNPDFDRYSPCPSNPEWLSYSRFVIRMIAESGFDGVFIDNNSIEDCCCQACQEGFRKWLAARRPGETASLPEALVGSPLLQDEAADFYADQIRIFLTECQAAGEAVHPGFFLCPNWTGSATRWNRDHVWYRIPNAWPMRELDLPLGEGEADAFGQQPGYWGTVPFYKWDARLHARGAGRTIMLNYQTQPANWVELAQAEGAAFGEGAVQCAFAGGPDVQAIYARYRRFYRDHRELFAPLQSYARVGVLCFRHGEPTAMSLGRMLLEAHVPFDFLDSRDLTPPNLKRFGVLCCNGVTQVSDAELRALREHVRQGGRLIISGPFAATSQRYEPRQTGPLFDLVRERRPAPFLVAEGRGFVAYTPLVLTTPAREVLGGLLRLLGVSSIVRGGPHPGLRVNAYAGHERLAVHLVNFRVPREGEPIPQAGVTLRIPVPAAWDHSRLTATWHEPGCTSQTLVARVRAGSVEVVVPRLRVYGVMEVRTK
jgi:hypothetical protein